MLPLFRLCRTFLDQALERLFSPSKAASVGENPRMRRMEGLLRCSSFGEDGGTVGRKSYVFGGVVISTKVRGREHGKQWLRLTRLPGRRSTGSNRSKSIKSHPSAEYVPSVQSGAAGTQIRWVVWGYDCCVSVGCVAAGLALEQASSFSHICFGGVAKHPTYLLPTWGARSPKRGP